MELTQFIKLFQKLLTQIIPETIVFWFFIF